MTTLPEPLPRPEPPENPRLTHLRWCLLVRVDETKIEHTFSQTSDLLAYLAQNNPKVLKIEIEGPEDVSDVVSFFGTPVHPVFDVPAPYLLQMLQLLKN